MPTSYLGAPGTVAVAGPGAVREGIDEMRDVTSRLIELVNASAEGFDLVAGFSQGGEGASVLVAWQATRGT